MGVAEFPAAVAHLPLLDPPEVLAQLEKRASTLAAEQEASESLMQKYGFAVVLKSGEQMGGNGFILKLIVGRMALAGMRLGLRIATPCLR